MVMLMLHPWLLHDLKPRNVILKVNVALVEF
jgi:hypothetical protein